MKLMKSNGAIVFALILLLSNLGLADAIAEARIQAAADEKARARGA